MNSANTTKSSHTNKANDIQPEINVKCIDGLEVYLLRPQEATASPFLARLEISLRQGCGDAHLQDRTSTSCEHQSCIPDYLATLASKSACHIFRGSSDNTLDWTAIYYAKKTSSPLDFQPSTKTASNIS